MVGRSQLLVGAPGDGRLVVGIAGCQAGVEVFDLTLGEPFDAGTEDVANLVERVVLPAAVADLPRLAVPPIRRWMIDGPADSARWPVVLRALSAARFLPEEDVRPVPGSRSGCPAWVADNG